MIAEPTNSDFPELDISALGRALNQLDVALTAWAERPDDDLIRDAVIQRFEFTYELSVRMLRRYLRLIAATDDDVNELTFKDLVRRGDELSMLRGGVVEWAKFRKARTDTVHTYNEVRAKEVAAVAKDFAEEARVLFDSLSGRLTR